MTFQIVQSDIIKGEGVLPHAVVVRRFGYNAHSDSLLEERQYVVHTKTWKDSPRDLSDIGFYGGWYGRRHHADTGEHLTAALAEYARRCAHLGLDVAEPAEPEETEETELRRRFDRERRRLRGKLAAEQYRRSSAWGEYGTAMDGGAV